ncbi:MAG: YqgE/AlgH family protein [Aestuariivirga sp.]|uniref:YqgE/AlgH family protein n=1 Tax=Aestuariivirga sp. TaxID=2650926 RepID=UPI0025BE6E17|nr:YqgE/AlgH family protein [Aestuariivirga sp.]MCA3560800.1 YqgE/AlgH family protein [Aestuariivirga sp.]
MTKGPYLDGQLLIAMPGMSDPRFERSVIYMCAHSEQGAMGIIINKITPMMSFGELLSQLDLAGEDALAPPVELMQMPVLFGGPVEQGRGFVLHTSDYFTADSSLPVTENIALTATVDILRAMARGGGPQRAVLALGYSGWAPGQLENEIQHNGWLTCHADTDIIFEVGFDDRYHAALRKLKIDPAMLSRDSGHA